MRTPKYKVIIDIIFVNDGINRGALISCGKFGMEEVMVLFYRFEKVISTYRNYFLISMIFLFLAFLFSLSTMHLLRWDLNDSLAIGIRWMQGLSFYPDPQKAWQMEYGLYFPGRALFISILSAMGLKMPAVQVLMLALASVVFLLFVYVQHLTVKIYVKDASNHSFFMFALLFYLLPANEHLFYAVEFKPDTLAFLLGVVGILVRFSKPGISSGIIAGLLIGLPIIFKQQYLGFFVPVVGCFLLRRDYLVSIIAIFVFIGSLVALGQIEHIWYFTVFGFEGAPTVNLRTFAGYHTTLIIGFFPLLLFVFWNGSLRKILAEAISFVLDKKAYMDPLFMGLLGAAAACYASALLVGASGAIVAMAYACMLPYFWILFRKYISARIAYLSFAVLCFNLIITVPRTVNFADNFEQLQKAYTKAVGSTTHVLITNSNFYPIYANSNRIYINPADIDKDKLPKVVMTLAKQGEYPIFMLGNNLNQKTFNGRVGEKLFENQLGSLVKF